MFFSTIFSFAVLLATAAADLHNECVCVYGESYNPYLTKAACSNYAAAKYKWGVPVFDIGQGYCTGVNNTKIAGDQWETACRTAAQHTSFPCSGSEEKCWASVDQTFGAC